jgi:hypothetical protein
MADWNPFLLAVAYKKIDIVRYFTEELKVSVKHAGIKPGDAMISPAQQSVDS